MQPPRMALPQLGLALPQDLVDKIMNAQETVVSKSTQAHDPGRLREFLQFCEGHGIKSSDAFPAKEDLLVAWAASYAGRFAGRTVSAKLLAIRREHDRRGLAWQGGVLLRRILKVVEELRPPTSFNSKRAPSNPMLEDSESNRGLTAAGDVKPAAPKSESDDSSQSDDDDDVKAEPLAIVVDSSESDSDGGEKKADAVSVVKSCEFHSHTFCGQIVICLYQRTSARLRMMPNLKPKRQRLMEMLQKSRSPSSSDGYLGLLTMIGLPKNLLTVAKWSPQMSLWIVIVAGPGGLVTFDSRHQRLLKRPY